MHILSHEGLYLTTRSISFLASTPGLGGRALTPRARREKKYLALGPVDVTVLGYGRVNCPFYFKVGACRHGDRCSRQHNKPLFSQTVLLAHMYQAPNTAPVQSGPTAMSTAADDKPGQEHFDDFYEEVRVHHSILLSICRSTSTRNSCVCVCVCVCT